MTMNDPLLRTDSYAKIFLYNTHETVACVPRHTIRMRVKCARTSCAKPSSRHCCAFRT